MWRAEASQIGLVSSSPINRNDPFPSYFNHTSSHRASPSLYRTEHTVRYVDECAPAPGKREAPFKHQKEGFIPPCLHTHNWRAYVTLTLESVSDTDQYRYTLPPHIPPVPNPRSQDDEAPRAALAKDHPRRGKRATSARKR